MSANTGASAPLEWLLHSQHQHTGRVSVPSTISALSASALALSISQITPSFLTHSFKQSKQRELPRSDAILNGFGD